MPKSAVTPISYTTPWDTIGLPFTPSLQQQFGFLEKRPLAMSNKRPLIMRYKDPLVLGQKLVAQRGSRFRLDSLERLAGVDTANNELIQSA